MTHAEAVSKAVRLLRLAQSDNANEAALAAAKAQEIIDRYKLGSSEAEARSIYTRLTDAVRAAQSTDDPSFLPIYLELSERWRAMGEKWGFR